VGVAGVEVDHVHGRGGLDEPALAVVEHPVLTRDRHHAGIVITLLSFGFKHGLPVDADLVFDVRCLPNPFFVPALRKPVSYVMPSPRMPSVPCLSLPTNSYVKH